MFKFNFLPSSNNDGQESPSALEIHHSEAVTSLEHASSSSSQCCSTPTNLQFLNWNDLAFPSSVSAISSKGNILFSMESMMDPNDNDNDNNNASSCDESLNYLRRIQTCSKSADRLIQQQRKQQQQQGTKMASPRMIDVIPGFYEGGLKVWECSMDLCRFLREEILKAHHHHSHEDSSSLFHCTSFLELGCGHGLPSCLLLRAYQMYPHLFQNISSSNKKPPLFVLSDYNEFVLKEVTWPNLVLNISPWNRNIFSATTSDDPSSSSYPVERDFLADLTVLVSGDWNHLSNHLLRSSTRSSSQNDDVNDAKGDSPTLPTRFDCILAAETLYTLSSTRDTAHFIVRHLTLETGIALIATKRFYFGMGLNGGTDAFMSILGNEKWVDERNQVTYQPFIETICVYEEGTVRDLLRVRLVRSE